MPEPAALDEIVLANLTPEERTRSAVYVNDTTSPSGHATIGGQQTEIDHPWVVAFIDRNPGANWMHPSRYLVINPADGKFISIESNRPPAFGPLPNGWRLIWRSPGVEDWQVLKLPNRPVRND